MVAMVQYLLWALHWCGWHSWCCFVLCSFFYCNLEAFMCAAFVSKCPKVSLVTLIPGFVGAMASLHQSDTSSADGTVRPEEQSRIHIIGRRVWTCEWSTLPSCYDCQCEWQDHAGCMLKEWCRSLIFASLASPWFPWFKKDSGILELDFGSSLKMNSVANTSLW